MVWVILALTVAAIPVLVAIARWEWAELQERRETAELTREAEQLPVDIARFSPEQARKASGLLSRASELETRLPSEIPGIARLWQHRHSLQDITSHSEDNHDLADVIESATQYLGDCGHDKWQPFLRAYMENVMSAPVDPLSILEIIEAGPSGDIVPAKRRTKTQVDVLLVTDAASKREIEIRPELQSA